MFTVTGKLFLNKFCPHWGPLWLCPPCPPHCYATA